MSERRRSSRANIAAGASGAVLLVGLLGSCLVTSKVEYDQPIIVSQVDRVFPTTEFTPMPVERDEECVREGNGHMRFAVEIRDLNREEELGMRIVVNKNLLRQIDVPPNGNELRELEDPFFCLEESDLAQPCNLVEVVVSSSFRGFDRRDPYGARLGDRAFVHWWVIGNAEDNPGATFLDCPDARPDAGVP